MKTQDHLTNEQLLKCHDNGNKTVSTFDFVNYTIKLARVKIRSGVATSAATSIQNCAYQTLQEVLLGLDKYEDIKKSSADDTAETEHNIYEDLQAIAKSERVGSSDTSKLSLK